MAERDGGQRPKRVAAAAADARRNGIPAQIVLLNTMKTLISRVKGLVRDVRSSDQATILTALRDYRTQFADALKEINQSQYDRKDIDKLSREFEAACRAVDSVVRPSQTVHDDDDLVEHDLDEEEVPVAESLNSTEAQRNQGMSHVAKSPNHEEDQRILDGIETRVRILEGIVEGGDERIMSLATDNDDLKWYHDIVNGNIEESRKLRSRPETLRELIQRHNAAREHIDQRIAELRNSMSSARPTETSGTDVSAARSSRDEGSPERRSNLGVTLDDSSQDEEYVPEVLNSPQARDNLKNTLERMRDCVRRAKSMLDSLEERNKYNRTRNTLEGEHTLNSRYFFTLYEQAGNLGGHDHEIIRQRDEITREYERVLQMINEKAHDLSRINASRATNSRLSSTARPHAGPAPETALLDDDSSGDDEAMLDVNSTGEFTRDSKKVDLRYRNRRGVSEYEDDEEGHHTIPSGRKVGLPVSTSTPSTEQFDHHQDLPDESVIHVDPDMSADLEISMAHLDELNNSSRDNMKRTGTIGHGNYSFDGVDRKYAKKVTPVIFSDCVFTRRYLKRHPTRSRWNMCQNLCKGLGYKRRETKYEISELYGEILGDGMNSMEMVEYLAKFRELHSRLVNSRLISSNAKESVELLRKDRDISEQKRLIDRLYDSLYERGIYRASSRVLLRKRLFRIRKDGVTADKEYTSLVNFVNMVIAEWLALSMNRGDEPEQLSKLEEGWEDVLSEMSIDSLVVVSMDPESIFSRWDASFNTIIEPVSLFMFRHTIYRILPHVFSARYKFSDNVIIEAFTKWCVESNWMDPAKASAFIENLVKFVKDDDLPKTSIGNSVQELIIGIMDNRNTQSVKDACNYVLYSMFSTFYGCALERHFEVNEEFKVAIVRDCIEKLGRNFMHLGEISLTEDQAVRYFPGICSAMYHRGELMHQFEFMDSAEKSLRKRFVDESRNIWMNDRDVSDLYLRKGVESVYGKFGDSKYPEDLLILPNFGYMYQEIEDLLGILSQDQVSLELEMEFGARFTLARLCLQKTVPRVGAKLRNPFTRHSMNEFPAMTDIPAIERYRGDYPVMEDVLDEIMKKFISKDEIEIGMFLSAMLESYCLSGRRLEDFNPVNWEKTPLSTEAVIAMVANPEIRFDLIPRICQMITNGMDYVASESLFKNSSFLSEGAVDAVILDWVARIILAVQNSASSMRFDMALRWFYSLMIGKHFTTRIGNNVSVSDLMEIETSMLSGNNAKNWEKSMITRAYVRAHEAYVGHVDTTVDTILSIYESFKVITEECLSESTVEEIKKDIIGHLESVDGLSGDTVISQCTAIVHVLSKFGKMNSSEEVDPRFSMLRIAGCLLSLAILKQKAANARVVARKMGRPNKEHPAKIQSVKLNPNDSRDLKELIEIFELMIGYEVDQKSFEKLGTSMLDLESRIRGVCGKRYRNSVDIIMSETLHAPVPKPVPAPAPKPVPAPKPAPAPRTRPTVVTFTVKEIEGKPFKRHATQSIINGLLQTLVVMCSDERYFKRHFDEELRVYREITKSSGTTLKMFLDDCPDTKEEERLLLDNKLVDYYSSRLERRCQKYCNTGMNMVMMIHLTFKSAIRGITKGDERLIVDILKRVFPKYPELLLLLFYDAVGNMNDYDGCTNIILTSSMTHDGIMSIVSNNRSSLESAISTFYVPGRIGEPVDTEKIHKIISVAHLCEVLDAEYMQKVFQKYMPEWLLFKMVTGDERSVDLSDDVPVSSRTAHGSTPAVAHTPVPSSHGAGHSMARGPEVRHAGKETGGHSSRDKSVPRFGPSVDREAVAQAANEFQSTFDHINVNGQLDRLIDEAAAYTANESIGEKLKSIEDRAVDVALGSEIKGDKMISLFKIVFWKRVQSRILANGMSASAYQVATVELGRLVGNLITGEEGYFLGLPDVPVTTETGGEEY